MTDIDKKVKKWLIVDEDLDAMNQECLQLNEIGFVACFFHFREKLFDGNPLPTIIQLHQVITWNRENLPAVVQWGALNGRWAELNYHMSVPNPDAEYILFTEERKYLTDTDLLAITTFDKSKGLDPLLDYARRLLEG